MATLPTYELATPTSRGSTSRRVALGPKIAAGAAGTVFETRDDPSTVVKIYHDTSSAKDLANSARQVQAMLVDPPDLPPIQYQGRSYVQIAWPTALLLKDGKFVGFSMPALEMKRTKVLEYLLQDKQAMKAGLRYDMGARVTVARQLAGVVAALHQKGHYVVDMKPVNLSYYPDTLYMAVLDCDGFNIHDESNGTNYPAPMFTAEYLAPEFQTFGANPNTDPKAQDKFALAVIIFQLLTHGTHPYSGVLSDRRISVEIKDRISRGDFPYGRRPNPNCAPIPSSTYRCLPDELVDCFERAFERDPARRPSAQEWTTRLEKYATPSTNNLVHCKNNPDHFHFAGLPCSRCALDRLTSGQAPLQAIRSNPSGASTSSRVPPPIPTSALPQRVVAPVPPPIPQPPPIPRTAVSPPPIPPAQAPGPILAPGISSPAVAVHSGDRRSPRNIAIGLLVIAAVGVGSYFVFTDHAAFNGLFTNTAAGGDDARPSATATPPSEPTQPSADASPAPTAAAPVADASAAQETATAAAAAASAAADAAAASSQPNANSLAAARDALSRGNLLTPAGTNAIDLTMMAWKFSPTTPDSRQLVVDVLKAMSTQQAEAFADKNEPLATLYEQKAESLVAATIGLSSPEWQAYQAAHSASTVAAAPVNATQAPPDGPRAITGIVQAAERGDWTSADSQTEALKQQVPPAVQGDRKSARELNAQGLAALNQHDYPAAIRAFVDAHSADPADIEVSNNLGSAYQQAGQNGQAIEQLDRTLLYAPARVSAWENLAHVYAQSGNLAAAEACARLTLRYSKNPAKTVTYMSGIVSANPGGTYEKILANVLRDQPPPTTAPAAAGQPAQPAAAADPRQSPQQSQAMDSAIQGMIADGQSCFARKNYSCAITSANNALRLNSGSVEARELKERAQEAQSQAMSNIDIH